MKLIDFIAVVREKFKDDPEMISKILEGIELARKMSNCLGVLEEIGDSKDASDFLMGAFLWDDHPFKETFWIRVNEVLRG